MRIFKVWKIIIDSINLMVYVKVVKLYNYMLHSIWYVTEIVWINVFSVCVCVCTCVCVCVYVYMFVSVCVCVYVCILYMYVCMCVCVCVCVLVCMCTYVYICKPIVYM